MQKYGLSPNTFYPWREKFLDGCKAALTGCPSARTAKAIQENATLKMLVSEITLAIGASHKNWRCRDQGSGAQNLHCPMDGAVRLQ